MVAEAVPSDTGHLQSSLQRQGVPESLSHGLFPHSMPSLPRSNGKHELSTIFVTVSLQKPRLKELKVQLILKVLKVQLIIEVRVHGRRED